MAAAARSPARVPAHLSARVHTPCAGTWMLLGGNMGYGCYTTTSASGSDYSCACAVPTTPLAWRPSSGCLQGAASATGGEWPPVCRHRRAHLADQPFRTGHVVPRRADTGDYACKAPDQAETFGYRDGIGPLPREFEVLCKGALFLRVSACVACFSSAARSRVAVVLPSHSPASHSCRLVQRRQPSQLVAQATSATTADRRAASAAWPAARPARSTRRCGGAGAAAR